MNLRSRKDPSIKDREFAEQCGLSESYLSQIINQHRPFGEKTARKIEKSLGLSPFELDLDPNATGRNQNVASAEIRGWIPLISYVQAGEWHDAIDLYEPGYAEHIAPTTVSHSLRTFALRVDGESMTLPDGVRGHSFPHGMIIYVDPDAEHRRGDYVVARLANSHQVTFKQLLSEEGRPVLAPLNPDRKAYPIIRDEFEIIGRVIDASWGGL